MALKPTKVQVRLQTGTDRTLYATWSWSKSGTDKYDVYWDYKTAGKSIWFVGSHGTSDTKQSTYSAPSNAIKVRFKVRAIAKKGQKWKCSWSTTESYDLVNENLTDPGAPTVSIIGNTLEASINDYTAVGASHVEFEIVQENIKSVRTQLAPLQTSHAAITWDGVIDGYKYKVRARGVKASNKSIKSANGTGVTTTVVEGRGPWSTYSENISSGYGPVTNVTVVTYAAYAEDNGGVRVSWDPADGFNESDDSNDVYEVNYTDDIEKFDSGDTETSGDHKRTHAEITGLELNKTYYFRVRASNGGNVHGKWSEIVSLAVGTIPDAPTTWSYTDVISIGQNIVLNWAHSSEDGSKQTAANITMTIGENTHIHTFDDETSTLVIQTDTEEHWKEIFGDDIPYITTDAKLYWKVSTKGIVPDYSPDSAERCVSIFEPVTLNGGFYAGGDWLWDPFIFATDTIHTAKTTFSGRIDIITSYPLRLGLYATPETQHAITYAVSIIATDDYDTEDASGSTYMVVRGQEIYSEYFAADSTDPNNLEIMLQPGDIDLENNQTYTLTATVAMDSGLTGEYETTFDVAFDDDEYELDADISVNTDDYSATITPICRDEFGNQVYNVYFNVFRREYNGAFTPIATNIDAADRLTLTDPHPSLDYARYRVVGITKKTGAVFFQDIPGYEIGMDSIILQWNEAWMNFDLTDTEDELDTGLSGGSMLVLPYNIDISAAHAPDVALVDYIGNEHPVSYYGTKKGETGSWNCEISRNDKDSLFALRRLANYMGDVYVREPSGIGYWAQVNVSYSLQHTKTTIPVSLNITRVTGGV